MNRFIVTAVACLLLLLQFHDVHAAGPAGPYDGEWKGTATSAGGARCKHGAAVNLTVEGQIVMGQAKFDGDASSINGAVNEAGSVGATVGFEFFKGQFRGDEFEGSFKFGDCQWDAVLKRTGAMDVNHASASRGRY